MGQLTPKNSNLFALRYEVEGKQRFPAVPNLKILYLLKTDSSTLASSQELFVSLFSRVFNLLTEPDVTLLCFVPHSKVSRVRYFLEVLVAVAVFCLVFL